MTNDQSWAYADSGRWMLGRLAAGEPVEIGAGLLPAFWRDVTRATADGIRVSVVVAKGVATIRALPMESTDG